MSIKGLVLTLLTFSTIHLFAQKKQPNIIVFIADDLGYEDTNPYGNHVIHTPNIQRLANEGMRFDNFFLTASSCSPSRSSILSGVYPHNTGAMNLHQDMSEKIELFPELLKQVGYYTMLIGKSHGTNKPQVRAKFDKVNLVNWSKPWEIGQMWLDALHEVPKDKPFFLWAASIDPHRPFKQGEYPYKHNPKDVIVPPYLPDIPEVRADMADYYDEIGRFDQQIGGVLKYLESIHELDNTFIIVISDNGKAYPQCKTRINVQGLRSPLIVRYPSMVKKGVSSKSLVSAIDLAPGILEIANAKQLKNGQGKSFLTVLKNPKSSIREFAFGEHNWHSYMAFERVAITKDYLYIKNWLPELPATPPGEVVPMPFYQKMSEMFESGQLNSKYSDAFIAPRPAEELFNKKKDINCMHNLGEDKKYTAELLTMQNALANWQKETGDFFPGKEKLKGDEVDRRFGKSNKKKN